MRKQGAGVRIPVRVSGVRSTEKPAAYILCGTMCGVWMFTKKIFPCMHIKMYKKTLPVSVDNVDKVGHNKKACKTGHSECG